jgi:DNA-binding MarR family transcriptional regulator
MPTTIKTTDLKPSRVDEAPVPAPAGSEPCLDDRELRAWRGLLRAHAALTKALDNQLEAGHGLPLMSYEVLMQLADADERRMRMRDLASSVILSRSGLTRLVDRLQREGLIDREQCASDARGAYAVLTESGRARLREAQPLHRESVRQRFLSRFSDDELRELAVFWARLQT